MCSSFAKRENKRQTSLPVWLQVIEKIWAQPELVLRRLADPNSALSNTSHKEHGHSQRPQRVPDTAKPGKHPDQDIMLKQQSFT